MHDAFLEIRAQIYKAWRWRWLGVPVCWAVALIGTLYVIMLPDVYKSSGAVRVDIDSALTPLMKGITVGQNAQRQVTVLQQTLLSGPNLMQVARTVDLDVANEGDAAQQSMIAALRNRIKMRARNANIIEVSYHDENPVRSRDVVQALLTVFIESNLGETRDDMVKAETFLNTQIAEYEAQLKAAEERLAQFQAKNMMILSGNGTYGQRYQQAIRKVEQLQYDIEEAEVARSELIAQLAKTPEYQYVENTADSIVKGKAQTSTLGQIRTLKQQLATLLVDFTEEHPDVVGIKKRLDILAERYKKEQSGEEPISEEDILVGTKIPNPLHEQLTLRRVTANEDIARLTRRLQQAEKDLESMKKFAAIAPTIQAEMASLDRDYATIKKKYETLLDRRESARLSRALEASTDPVQFRAFEPPSVPALPSGPPRLIFLAIVLVMAFGAGGGISFLRGQLEDTFSVPSKLSEAFQMPVIGSVSKITDLGTKARGLFDHMSFIVAVSAPVLIIAMTALLLPRLGSIRTMLSETVLGSFI